MQYDMVFEGGGAKGVVFVGALQEVERRGHPPARLLGASAGAIMATFLAAGYSASEMGPLLAEEIDGEPVFKGFLEIPPRLSAAQLKESAFRKLLAQSNSLLIPDFIEDPLDDALVKALSRDPTLNQVLYFFDYGGFFAGQYFLDWLRNKLNEGACSTNWSKFGQGQARCFGDMNLAQYYEATGVELSLVASDTTDARMLVLNHRTAPDCPLIYAVRMSMSYPLLWSEVVWEAQWGEYRHKNITGHTIVDGGMLSNFPIELFISNLPYITAVMGEKTTGSDQILGFLIDDALEVPNAPLPPKGSGILHTILAESSQLKIVQRVGKLINTMTQAHDKLVLDQYDPFVIHLPAKGYETTEFDMDKDRRTALVTAGKKAAQDYFDAHLPPETEGFGLERDLEPARPPDFYDDADRIAKRMLAL